MTKMNRRAVWTGAVVLATLGACGELAEPVPEAPPATYEELPIGPVEGMEDIKADGNWGYATECKPIPDLDPLVDPAIVISLDGLTLHLVDRAGTYDAVFPIGVGQIEDGESLTPVSTGLSTGVFHTRTDLPSDEDGATPATARWSWNYRCRFWWTDDDGEKVPVFAGLPFIRLVGPSSSGYGIHGPIDRFYSPTGGQLRRGYVSHGCIRMEAADLVEVYALIEGHQVPVRVQKAIERLPNDVAVDVDPPWLMSECRTDVDCGFEGGVCRQNAYSGRGFCTLPCDRYCPDRYGYPTTFCVDDPDSANSGMCVFQSSDLANGCRRFDHFVAQSGTPRYGQSWVQRTVCLPGTEGWIGDRCLFDDECMADDCQPVDGGPIGICSEPCWRYCADLDGGYAETFCISREGVDGGTGGMCVARCSTNEDCPLGTTCEASPRNSQATVVRSACVPY